MNISRLILGVAGNASALFLFLSPVITFKRIIKNRSVEQFSGIPYVMTLLNNLLSTWYGLPFISPNNILVSTVNGTGAVIEITYVMIFIIFAPKREKAKIGGLLLLIVCIFSIVAFVSIFELHGYNRKMFCGLAAMVFSIVMYASPLSIMRTVIRTKSVEFMPFFLSLFVFLCGTSWFLYGLIGKDPFVYVQNGIGSALGAVQLILYFIYRKNKGKPKPIPEDSIEMGHASYVGRCSGHYALVTQPPLRGSAKQGAAGEKNGSLESGVLDDGQMAYLTYSKSLQDKIRGNEILITTT